MKIITFFLLVWIAALSTGCPLRLTKNVPNKKVVETLINRYIEDFKKEEARYYCYVTGYDYNNTNPITCEKSRDPNIPKFEAQAKVIRTKIAESFITNIDNNYEQFVNDLQTNRSTRSFLADVTELGVGTAIGITNGERAIQILGVALTAFRGGRKSAELNFYQQQSTPILITKMDTSRARVMSAILQKRELSPQKYSLEAELGDVIKYFWAGTLTRAFVELNKDSSQQAKIAEDKLERLEGVPISDIPTIEQENIAEQIFRQIRDLDAQIKDADNAVKKAENGPDEEKAKAKAKKDKIKTDLENIWKDIEAESPFSPTIEKMKEAPELKEILDKVKNSPETVKDSEYLKLIRRFSTLTKEDLKLRKTFLEILNKGNR